jgi:hypothetical protein
MELEDLQRQLKHMTLEVEGSLLHAAFGSNSYTTIWPPVGEELRRLRQCNYEIGATHFLEKQFPDLLVQVHIYPEMWMGAPDVSVWIKRRAKNKWTKEGWDWQDQGAETLGSYPLSKGIRKVLAALERVAWNAKGPGMFLCTSCRRAQPVEDMEEVVFAGHYCKSCYQNDPWIKRSVDESRMLGFYE